MIDKEDRGLEEMQDNQKGWMNGTLSFQTREGRPMIDKKFLVPEDGLNAAWGGYKINVLRKGLENYDTLPMMREAHEARKEGIRAAIKEFIRWQDGKLDHYKPGESMYAIDATSNQRGFADGFTQAIEAVRRMYLAPEPEVPEAIKSFMFETKRTAEWTDIANERILEAYRRGQKAGMK